MASRNIRVIIAGGRDFDNLEMLTYECDRLLGNRTNIEIVSGGARGADELGEQYAVQRGFTITKFPADWNTHGKRAGYLRNSEMAEYADALIGFWDGKSKGTKHMIDLARKNNLRVRIIKY